MTKARSKAWKCTEIHCILLLPRRNWKIVSDLKRKQSGSHCGQKITLSFTAGAGGSFFPRMYCHKHERHDKREPELFKEEFRCTLILCFCSKTYCCCDVAPNKFKIRSKRLSKRVLEQSGDVPLGKYAASWTKKRTLRQQTELSAETIKLLLHMNKSKRLSYC